MTNAELTQVVEQQQTTIDRLRNRMGSLIDDMAVLRGNIETFKGHVSDDMRRVVEAIRKK